MFNIRAFYFYLLAVKIALARFLKKIYFTTNYYNKTLRTKSPQQLYFYPNPYLLSSFVNQKIFTFQLSFGIFVLNFSVESQLIKFRIEFGNRQNRVCLLLS